MMVDLAFGLNYSAYLIKKKIQTDDKDTKKTKAKKEEAKD